MRLHSVWLVALLSLVPAAARANDHTAGIFFGPSFASGSTLRGIQMTLEVSFPSEIEALHDHIGIIGDWSVHGGSHAGSDITRATFVGGVRLSDRIGATRNVPSVHALFGLVRTQSSAGKDNNFAITVGAGYEFLLSEVTTDNSAGWSLRTQADYVREPAIDNGFTRFTLGVAYRFKLYKP